MLKLDLNANYPSLWRNTLEKGKFWKWAKLSVNLVHHPEQREKLIHSRKLALVTEMKILSVMHRDQPLVESLLHAISVGATPKMEKLFISLGPWNIDASLLSRAVIKVEDCRVKYGSHHLEAIFTAIIQSQDLAIKRLTMEFSSAEVSADVMTAAAVRLEGLYLGRVTPAQVEELLTRLANNQDIKLKVFEFGCFNPGPTTS